MMDLAELLTLSEWGVQVDRTALPEGFFSPSYSGSDRYSDRLEGGTTGRCLYCCLENLAPAARGFRTAAEALLDRQVWQQVRELAWLTRTGKPDLRAPVDGAALAAVYDAADRAFLAYRDSR